MGIVEQSCFKEKGLAIYARDGITASASSRSRVNSSGRRCAFRGPRCGESNCKHYPATCKRRSLQVTYALNLLFAILIKTAGVFRCSSPFGSPRCTLPRTHHAHSFYHAKAFRRPRCRHPAQCLVFPPQPDAADSAQAGPETGNPVKKGQMTLQPRLR